MRADVEPEPVIGLVLTKSPNRDGDDSAVAAAANAGERCGAARRECPGEPVSHYSTPENDS